MSRLPVKMEGPFQFFTCTCGNYQAVNRGMPWCGSCRVEYDVKDGQVILRPKRKTAKYALAKVLGSVGGIKIGGQG